MLFPTVCVSAPSKAILAGEHAVVYGKRALAGSLDLRTRMRISPNDNDDAIAVDFPDLGFKRAWPLKAVDEQVLSRRSSVLASELDRDFLQQVVQPFVRDDDSPSLVAALPRVLLLPLRRHLSRGRGHAHQG